MAFRPALGCSPRIKHSRGDPDATAFLNAVLCNDATKEAALRQLVADLKAAGIWAKCVAIWPFVCGSAAAHKFNLKDPRDADAAYRLTFAGTITHTANGAFFNGVDGYADTHLCPTGLISHTDHHISAKNFTTTPADTGHTVSLSQTVGTVENFNFYTKWQATQGIRYSNKPNASQLIDATNRGSYGFTLATRTNSTITLYRDGVQIATATPTAPQAYTTALTFFLACSNSDGVPTSFNQLWAQFISIGQGLTATEAGNLATAVATYNAALGRT